MKFTNKDEALVKHDMLINEYTFHRNIKMVSQNDMERQTGLGQNLISKIEHHKNAPKVLTLLRLLLPLGKTLSITPLSDEEKIKDEI